MILSAVEAIEQARTLYPKGVAQRASIDRIDKWYRGQNEDPFSPKAGSPEYQALKKMSPTRWLGLVVTAVTQALYVEGFRTGDATDAEAAGWQAWQANKMDARQIPLHRAAVAHAQAHVSILPGTLHGEPMPVIRGHSMRSMIVAWDDIAQDDWPELALRFTPGVNGSAKMQLVDGRRVFDIVKTENDGWEVVDETEHNAYAGGTEDAPEGVCPVVRYVNSIDLDGRAEGEIEALIPNASRIDQDTFDRLVVQHFSAWQVRTATGLLAPETDEGKRADAMQLRQGDLLVGESPDTRFGVLPAAPMGGHIEARDSDIRDLAAASQTPPHHLLGSMVNLSAEALAAAEAGLNRKVDERKHTLGESHEQTLQVASYFLGDYAGATDFNAEVRWADKESRSLAQVADALGKLSTMLGVPPQALWDRIPGWTDADTTRADALLAKNDTMQRLLDGLDTASDPGIGSSGSGLILPDAA